MCRRKQRVPDIIWDGWGEDYEYEYEYEYEYDYDYPPSHALGVIRRDTRLRLFDRNTKRLISGGTDMLKQKRMLAGLLLLLSLLCLAGGSAQNPDEDNLSTSTVTHIEYSPVGLFKMEIPWFKMTQEQMKKEQAKDQMGFVQVAVFGLIQASSFRTPSYAVEHIYVLSIPFAQFLTTHRVLPLFKNERGEFPNENPFKSTWQFDEPLFCLYDGLAITYNPQRDTEEFEQKKNTLTFNDTDESPEKQKCVRKRYLDSLVFTLYEKSTWGADSYDVEWLDLPLITSFEHIKGPRAGSWQILETPLTTCYTKKWKGERSDVRFLDFWAASLYEKEMHEDGASSWKYLSTWPITLVKGSEGEKCKKVSVLETTHILTAYWTRFSLWQKEKKEDGSACRQYLRLPLLGPVWSTWKEGADGETKNAPFPRLLYWHAPKYVK